MITHYLECSIKNIEDLITLTKSDIEDIKRANNEAIYKRTKLKDEIIGLFEQNKTLLDKELIKFIDQNHQKDLAKLLNKDQKDKLDILKSRLQELQILNKNYAKLVVAVNEFYTSLFDRIFPTEMEQYKKTNPKSFSLLKVSA